VTGAAESDEDLMRRIAGGDRLAMRVLFGRHHLRVHRFVCGMLRDGGGADDVLDDVFFEVWQQAGRFDGHPSVSTWILGMARHKALGARPRRSAAAPDAAVAKDGHGPAIGAQEASRDAVLQRCIGALSNEHRGVTDLVYYHEKTVEDVAQIMGAPANTIKMRMYHARRKLSELLLAAGIDRGGP
jgi:RNA polymerase sigma-70 factor (ECF subfamily)